MQGAEAPSRSPITLFSFNSRTDIEQSLNRYQEFPMPEGHRRESIPLMIAVLAIDLISPLRGKILIAGFVGGWMIYRHLDPDRPRRSLPQRVAVAA